MALAGQQLLNATPMPGGVKNFGTSLAAGDLGLGDQLQAETQDQLLERRKKLLQIAPSAAFGALGLGTGIGQGGQSAAAALGLGGLGG